MTVDVQLIHGSALHIPLDDESVQCVVTSPPYWGLRQYAGEQVVPEWGCALGLEPTPELYVEHMIEVFREVRRVLRRDGTLWLNLGDSYAASGRGGNPPDSPHQKQRTNRGSVLPAGLHESQRQAGVIGRAWSGAPAGYKPKDLVGIPWMVAFALRADGWYLRSDIIWHKPNPMPESVTDRPTKSHEYLFLLAKSERYYYDADPIREPLNESSIARISQPTFDQQTGGPKDYGPDSNRSQRKTLENFKRRQTASHDADTASAYEEGSNANRLAKLRQSARAEGGEYGDSRGRNKRTVWTIPTRPYPGAHFATYPEKLVEPCVLAGSRPGDVVLDPFNGSGTTGRVAVRLGRSYVGVDISKEYIDEQAVNRIYDVQMEAAL